MADLKLFLHRLIRVLVVLSSFYSGSMGQSQRPIAKLTIGVLDFDARSGIAKEEAASLSDIFSAQLVKSGQFVVVDRNRIRAILEEQGFQQSESCSQVECVVAAGKILKLQKMFAGTIGKIGKVYNVAVQLIDIETAQIQFVETKQHEGEIEDLVYEVIPEIASEMIRKMTGKEVDTSISRGGSNWYWYVGGAVLVGGGAAAFLLLKSSKGNPTQVEKDLPGPPGLP